MKTEIMWILHKEGTGFIAMIATHRYQLKTEVCWNYGEKWPALKKKGYSMVKVNVSPFKK